MDRPTESRRRAQRLLLAGVLGVAVLGALPWSAAAAIGVTVARGPDGGLARGRHRSPEPTAPEPTPPPDADPHDRRPAATPDTRAGSHAGPVDADSGAVLDPDPEPDPTDSTTSVNLYRYSAMVRQYTNYWCVPATVQSMANLVLGTSNKTYARQAYIYRLTRQHNRYRYATRGNDPQGWAWSLRYFTHHRPYYARAYTDKTKAINSIATSIARTRHPVGVTVYSGTHAWVVLGYRQSFDRTEPSKKTLLGLYVSGPLGTSRDRWPYRYLTVAQFKEVFTRYHEWQRRVIWEGKWVVVAQ